MDLFPDYRSKSNLILFSSRFLEESRGTGHIFAYDLFCYKQFWSLVEFFDVRE